MVLKLQDFIDIDQFQMLQDRLNEIYSFPSAIIDNEGKILTATAWQDVCTKFHRQNSECEKECIKSDQYIADHLHEANPAVSYRCPHGLIDNATPIIIEGVHYGNFFTGQFFLEPPDLNFFRAQAQRYSFDEEAYLEAVKKVPIWTKEQLDSYLFFIKGLIEVISGIGLKNLKEIETRKLMQESEEGHKAILQTAMDGFWLVDLKGRLLEVNDTYCRISGYSEQELLTMCVPDLEATETADDVAAHIQKIIERGEDRFESRHRRKDGSIYYVETRVQYRPTNGGRFVVFLRDVTERRHVEEELRESEEGYRTLFSSAGDGILIMSLEGKLVEVNESFARMHGYRADEMLQMNLKDLDTPETFQQAPERIRRILAGEALTFEVEHYHKDGSVFPLEVSASLISSGRGSYVQCFHRDITTRKKIEEELAQSHDLLKNLARLVPGVIYQYRLYSDGRSAFPYSSPGMNDIYEVTPEDVREDATPVFGRLHPDDYNHVSDAIQESARNLQTFYCEFRVILPRQGLRWRWSQAHPERLADGSTLWHGIISDITDRKQLDTERLSLLERLNRSEKMEALGQLAGGVAHDLNNVLGILSGYSELLLDEIPEGGRARGHVEKILQSTEKGAAIIQDLLTLARRGVTATDVINLNSVVSDFLKTPVFEKIKDYHPRVTFSTECDKNLLNIKGSPVHLEKTLMNLISNATEAITETGEVTIRTENRYLDAPIKGYDEVKPGDYIVLTVSDTGMGIPAEDREKIFEPFYTKKAMGRSGTGLGLAIVWGTVKDHNAYIDLQTEIGKGTTFTLYFPVTREELIAPQQKVSIEQYMGKGESVLVVDDIAEQRDIASRLLIRLGYEVHLAVSGEEAVEYLKDNRTDILVLDMIMAPGIDGLETYQRVLEISPNQKAILVSGFSETDRVREAQKLGAGAYVKKPYMTEKIGIAIRDELARKR